jgi:predicted enzyme related to lactoylglutathione lyase
MARVWQSNLLLETYNIQFGRQSEPTTMASTMREERRLLLPLAIQCSSAILVLLGLALLYCTFGCANTASSSAPQPLPPLTTVSGSPRLPGKFVWADLVTDDVPAARTFYSDLFGWTFQTISTYTIMANLERPICGMFQRPRPKEGSAQPRWFGYISISSVSRAESTATKLGGRVLFPPQEFPKRGEQAVFADPEGAVFGVVKSSSGDPEDLLAEPGDWIWIQLLSRDAQKAAEFYRSVAGYEIVGNTTSNRLSDYVLTSKGYARATVRTIPKANTQVQPTWLPFVRVKNIAESLARAKQLGGKVLIDPKPEVFEGKACVIADPTGAAVGLLEWSQDLAKKGTRQ